ncbi:hypothetical protein ROZALSC1DRAFT_31333, partial [Rozella allomycis CSF55]
MAGVRLMVIYILIILNILYTNYTSVPIEFLVRHNFVNRVDMALYKPKLVLHISKEYGKAKFGGMGTLITALANAQSLDASNLKISVLIPFYSFLKIRYTDISLECHVNVNISYTTLSVPIWRIKDGDVVLFLAGQGNKFPFNISYYASNENEIYGDPEKQIYLSNDWKDLFFVKTAIEFAKVLGKQYNLIINAHGSTNALVGLIKYYMWVPFVYTVHDCTFEFDYSLAIQDLRIFFKDLINPRIWFLSQFKPSIFGLSHANTITTVSTDTQRRLLDDAVNSFTFNIRHMIKKIANSLEKVVVIPNRLETRYPIKPFEFFKIFHIRKSIREYLVHISVMPKESLRNEVWMLFVGRISKDKGADHFFGLIKRIAQHNE